MPKYKFKKNQLVDFDEIKPPKPVNNDFTFNDEESSSFMPRKKSSVGVEPPNYYMEDGSINPKYQSNSRGASALAGGKIGFGLRTGDPLFDAGAMLGGVIGGALNPKLAGKMAYIEDMAMANKENETTQAHQRLLAIIDQREQQAAKQKIADEKNQRAAATAAITDQTKLAKQLETNINSTSGEERRFYQLQHANLFKVPNVENLDDDYMVGWKNANMGGDVNYQVDGAGKIREAQFNGQSISRLGIKDLYDIAAKQNKMDIANVVDAEAIKEAFSEIDKVLLPMKEQFRTPSGKYDAKQYNAQRFQLVNKLLATKKANPELEMTEMEINVDGSPMMVKVPLIGKKPDAPLAPTTDSQFMPPIGAEGGIIKVPIPTGTNPNDAAVVQKDLMQPPTTELPKGVKPNVKYLQPDGSYLMFDGKGWVRFKKK